MKSLSFWVGYVLGIILSLTVSFIDYRVKFNGRCMDCDNDFGFPFRIYQEGGIMHATLILWDGLIANVVIAIVVSTIIGLVFHFLAAKLFKRTPLK